MTAPREAVSTALLKETLCAAAVRALTGDAALHYRGGRLCRQSRPLPLYAPHLQGDPYQDELASLRGAADGAAVRLLHSDAALHRSMAPGQPVERLLFEMFEQVRCEALALPGMHGLARNLRHRFEAWLRAYSRAGLADDHLGILIYTVVQVVWSRVTGWPVLDETEDLIEATRAGIVPAIGGHLAGMRKHRFDQRAYAHDACELARDVASMLDDASAAFASDGDGEKARKPHDALTSFSLWVDFDVDVDESGDAPTAGATANENRLTGASREYRVYTTQYDREVRAGALVRSALLREYREQLDERIAASGINVARIARVLQAALAVPQRDGWSFGEEEGRIDGRRLAQIISSPAERRVFTQERVRPRGDCVVGFLTDCSASMKAHIAPVAMLIDVLVRACEQAGVATEVLGFTTGAWNGGRARLDWLARGRPSRPGRLNEVCHMVFKSAADSWRRSRTDIAAFFKADLFREGVDGEAVEWACTRLAERASGRLHEHARRILVVISDGSPMDAATVQANDESYLDTHLKDVLARHEALKDVEVIGLGIGRDPTLFYRHCAALDPAAQLDMARVVGLAKWIAARR
ncbi:cobaltochelatase CobT-related protein [Trinickia dinghuensis]|uniref:Cobalt chelatase n=1 Tax=Trinickia dinghuensis TaxID=2291023 RepID=A0A3D8JWL4_9BURK|nr:cobalt chelatase [Trinickia dinghuensis]RDU97467.1 cobalt chelatase [Trinickia dinghuensis]